MEMTRSPSSLKRMTMTPCVARPAARMSVHGGADQDAALRVTRSRSSLPSTTLMPTTAAGLFRDRYSCLMPRPPRLVMRYSSTGVRLAEAVLGDGEDAACPPARGRRRRHSRPRADGCRARRRRCGPWRARRSRQSTHGHAVVRGDEDALAAVRLADGHQLVALVKASGRGCRCCAGS